jgi:hypothetical protein
VEPLKDVILLFGNGQFGECFLLETVCLQVLEEIGCADVEVVVPDGLVRLHLSLPLKVHVL